MFHIIKTKSITHKYGYKISHQIIIIFINILTPMDIKKSTPTQNNQKNSRFCFYKKNQKAILHSKRRPIFPPPMLQPTPHNPRFTIQYPSRHSNP